MRVWQQVLEQRLEACGGYQALEAKTEQPRYHMLHEACQKNDLFYLILHQYFCLWSKNVAAAHAILKLYGAQELVVDDAFKNLLYTLRDNKFLSSDHLAWLSSFPLGTAGAQTTMDGLAAVCQQVSLFLQRFSSQWKPLISQVVTRQCPIMAWELRDLLHCPSPTLQSSLFTVSRRKLGIVEGPLANELIAFFHSTASAELQLIHQAGSSYSSGLVVKAREEMMNRCTTLIKDRLNATPPQCKPRFSYFLQMLRANHPFFIVVSASSLPRLSPSSQAQRNGASPHSQVQNYPMHTIRSSANFRPSASPVTVQQFWSAPSGANIAPSALQGGLHPHASASADRLATVYHPAPLDYLGPSDYRSNGHSMPFLTPGTASCPQFGLSPAWNISPTVASFQQFAPFQSPVFDHATGSPSTQNGRPTVPVLQSTSAEPYLSGDCPPQAVTVAAPAQRHEYGGPPAVGQNRGRPTHQKPTLRHHSMGHSTSSSGQSGLHLVKQRSPERVPMSPGLGRHYQFVARFAVRPTAINFEAGLQKLRFSMSKEAMTKCALTRRSTTLPICYYFEGCCRYRLRTCLSSGHATQIDLSDWVTMPSQWPEHIHMSFNGRPVFARRKQHFHQDLPIELTDLLVAGENVVQASLPQVDDKWRDATIFMAVETVLTLSFDAVRAFIFSKPHMLAQYTKLEIKRRLKPSENDEVVIDNDSLSITIADPFTSRVFNTPVRGVTCKHLECFDLETWLESRPQKQHKRATSEPCLVDCWRCPICGHDARPISLQIDDFFVEVRQGLRRIQKENAKAIRVKADGSWEAIVEDDDSDDEMTPAPGPQAHHPLQDNKACPETIEILDD